jgi:TonB family protein
MTQRFLGAACLLASLGLHVGLLRSGPAGPTTVRPRAPSLVHVSVMPGPAPPMPPPQRPREAPPPPPKRQKPLAAPIEPTPANAANDAGEPAPAELTGNTLVGTSAALWVAPPGSGAERDGAIGAGLARTATPASRPSGEAIVAPPPAVPLAQLSRKPVPPPLAGVLERHYPAAARKQGLTGDAKVRARVEPTGEVREVSISLESAPGFGEACRRTLLASKWTAPLNEAGRPVATWVSYRCKFRIEN